VSPEIPDLDARTANLIKTLVTTLARPARMAIVSDPGNAEGGAFGYGLVLSIDAGGEQEAQGLHRIAGRLMQQAEMDVVPKASDRFPGMSEFKAGEAALFRFGPQQREGAWSYDIYVGSVADPTAALRSTGSDRPGFDSVFEFRFDTKGLETAFEMARGFAGADPNAAQMIDMIDEMDLFGDGSIALDVRSGFTEDASVTYTVLENAEKLKEALYLPDDSLTRDDFGAIPADAEMVWIAKDDFSAIRGMIEDAERSGADVRGALDMFEEQTGVDPLTDIVDALGGTIAVYTSDATGGGSLMSLVGMVSFKDRARFAEANEALVGMANLAAQQIPIPVSSVGVEVSSWEYDGVDLFSVRVAGVPMPVELSYSLTEDWLVFGFTPQAVIAAARQTEGRGDDGLLSNATFASAFPRGKEVVSLSYADAPGLIREGYPLMTLLSSAMGNLVRSPLEPQRDPGLIVAPMHDLVRGAAPQIEFSYWSGADLVTETRGDRSMVVNGAVIAGAINRVAPALLAIGAAIGSAGERGGFGMHDVAHELSLNGALSPEWIERWVAFAPGGYGPRRLADVISYTAVVQRANANDVGSDAIYDDASPGRPVGTP
jgi:hypothetical protein